MSDNITKARTFLKSFIDNRGGGLSEANAVLALVDYLAENGSSETGTTPVTETDEFKELSAKFDGLTEVHNETIHQRDHNWNELQKAQKELNLLKTPSVNLTPKA